MLKNMTTTILVPINEAAAMLGATRRRILRLVREGLIPFVDLGDGEPRFSPDDLRAWVQQKAKGGSDAK